MLLGNLWSAASLSLVTGGESGPPAALRRLSDFSSRTCRRRTGSETHSASWQACGGKLPMSRKLDGILRRLILQEVEQDVSRLPEPRHRGRSRSFLASSSRRGIENGMKRLDEHSEAAAHTHTRTVRFSTTGTNEIQTK